MFGFLFPKYIGGNILPIFLIEYQIGIDDQKFIAKKAARFSRISSEVLLKEDQRVFSNVDKKVFSEKT